MKTITFQAHLLILLATILIAGSFLASDKLSGLINPFSLTLLRFVGASLILFPFILYKKRYREKLLSTLPRALVISLFYSIFFICFFEALTITTTLNTGTLYTLVPFVTALLCWFFLKQRLNIKQLGIYLLGALGTAWVVFNGDIDSLLSFSLNNGDLIFLAGAFSMCCYSLSMKLMYKNDEMIVLVFCILVGGSVWMALALLFTGQPLDWDLLQRDSLLNMAYLIIAATLASVYLFQKTTVLLGPRRVMAYVYLNPGFVAILLFIVDGIQIPLVVIPGILLSSLATVFIQKDIENHKIN
ncbi:MAG TPA: DMT family transporter [Flavobacteriales bacterium]|nr:DMT family transporter [Flavobacteriales bacterium]